MERLKEILGDPLLPIKLHNSFCAVEIFFSSRIANLEQHDYPLGNGIYSVIVDTLLSDTCFISVIPLWIPCARCRSKVVNLWCCRLSESRISVKEHVANNCRLKKQKDVKEYKKK